VFDERSSDAEGVQFGGEDHAARQVAVFRGSDGRGNYVADVIGLDGESLEIPGAVKVERLLVPFWENGQHSAIPSILKQKVFCRRAATALRRHEQLSG
jgi:hypothetical protein